MKSIKFVEPKIIYEVVGKNADGDWETLKSPVKTLEEAVEYAHKILEETDYIFNNIDINMIIDDDLTGTYDPDGNIR